RVLFRRLAVFAGRWTLEAAEAVCSADDLATDEILEWLARLVDKSLVTHHAKAGDPHYRMLETIRQYAGEKLVESGHGDSVRDRHLNYYVRLAEDIETKQFTAEQKRWLAALESENDNLRAAIEWSLQSHQLDSGLRLASALNYFWIAHHYMAEGRARLSAPLADP